MNEERKDCTQCYWYWQNNDTENQCNGSHMWQPCDEFVESEVASDEMGATYLEY